MNALKTILSLAAQSLLNRRATVVLTMISIAVSVALLSGVQRVRQEARSSFANTISGADLIVGARSAPLQLLLYSIFRMGEPTQNLSWASYQTISSSPDTDWAIPLSLGDSHRGFRVVGTTSAYLDHYRYARGQRLTLAGGEWFSGPEQVVLGAAAASELGYGIGDRVVLSHGIGSASFSHHDAHPLTVSGILAPTGTPVDQALHVALSAVTQIHEPAAADADSAHESEHHDTEPESITAFLLGLKSPAATLRFQRAINTWDKEPLTAVIPGVALQQLWELVRVAEQALLAVSVGVVIAGLLGMLSALLTGLNERRREMAILRAVGARPWHLLVLLTTESGLIALIGAVSGLMTISGLLAFARPWLSSQFQLNIQSLAPGPFDLLLLVGVTVLAMLLALWPALRAYRTSLSDGLATRL